MLASLPADMVNQKLADLGIPNRFSLTSSRSSQSVILQPPAAPTSARARSRSTNFWIFPVAVVG
ncbi:MAG: hypothetical protein WBA14_20765, partial [Pseudolabrys sp.]